MDGKNKYKSIYSEDREAKFAEARAHLWARSVHQGFGSVDSQGKYYHQKWEEIGIDDNFEALSWIENGFKPWDYEEIGEWQRHGIFDPRWIRSWLNSGLLGKDEYEFAKILKEDEERYPNQYKKEVVEETKAWFYTAQNYLNCFFFWKIKEKARDLLDEVENEIEKKKNTIKKLDISRKKITGTLDLSDFLALEELECQGNKLTNLILPKELSNLKKLNLGDNDFNQNLSFLKEAFDLEELGLNNNNFTGSLEHLKEMNNLKVLNISNTDIDSGLEYLPNNLREFKCSVEEKDVKVVKVKILEEELKKYGEPEGDDFIHLLRSLEAQKAQRELSKPSKRGWKTNLEGIDIAPLVPIILHETFKRGKKLFEKHYLEENDEINYWEIYAKKPQILNSQVKSLPIKLYNIETGQIETTERRDDIKNYGIVSYVWGNPNDPKMKLAPKLEEKSWWKNYLTVSGNKTLHKAIQTCELWNKAVCQEKCGEACKQECNDLKINHLWMDQLCINQADTSEGLTERNQEVPKMGQYYGNTTVTLISIQSKINEKKPLTIDIIEKIIQSEWFRRSWTFQEGWLSKHTIFMFDDILVDGRALAADWILYQPAYSEYSRASLGEISEGSVKVATPVGWTYFKYGYGDKDRISLTLSQVLRGIKPRERTLSIDGIYSVLGLLPYGKDVRVNYKKRGYEYTQKELLEALYGVMKTAWEKGYGEGLGWHGEGFGLIPRISSVSKGSTSMVGGIVVKYKNPDNNSNFNSQEIKLNGHECIVESIIGNLEEVESGRQGFLIDSGLCAINAQVKVNDKIEEIKLWGAKETLNKVEKGYILIIPTPKEWESNIPFAILTSKSDNIYQRVGLIELRDEDKVKKLQGTESKELAISMNEYVNARKVERKATILVDPQSEQRKKVIEDLKKQIRELQSQLVDLQTQELQARIQVNPKRSN